MIIDNIGFIRRKWLFSLFLALLFVVSLALFFALLWNVEKLLGIPKYYYAIFISLIYFLINLKNYLLDINYLNFSDEKDKLEFKYYSTRPFASKHNFVAIPKNVFAKYDITEAMAGKKKVLTLYQKTNKGVAKYPSITLTGLTQQDYTKLISSLNRFVSK